MTPRGNQLRHVSCVHDVADESALRTGNSFAGVKPRSANLTVTRPDEGPVSTVPSTRKGCSCSLILTPCLRSSPAYTSSSNVLKRKIRDPERRHRRSGDRPIFHAHRSDARPDRDAPNRQSSDHVRRSPQIAPGSTGPFGVPSPVHASQPFAASKSPLLPLTISRSACGLLYSIGFKNPAGVPVV